MWKVLSQGIYSHVTYEKPISHGSYVMPDKDKNKADAIGGMTIVLWTSVPVN